MKRKPYDVPLKRIVIEHYLFTLGYSVEKVAEVFDEDKESIKEVYDDYKRYTLPEGVK